MSGVELRTKGGVLTLMLHQWQESGHPTKKVDGKHLAPTTKIKKSLLAKTKS
jgi:hypothetical protein